MAAFADELLLCAARVHVGPLSQTFWAIWDREARRLHERTRLLLPGARGEVWTEPKGGDEVAPEMGDYGIVDYAPDEGSLGRIEARDRELGEVRAFLHIGPGRWVEAACPTPEGGYVWTRKRAGVPIRCDVRLGRRRLDVEARGVEDESAGYHPHHTVWSWTAGVGRLRDGRSVGWSLVSGINDPPERSERGIWVEGEPLEPGPVTFEGLEAVVFDDGARLVFARESERAKEERRLFVSYSYRQPFGTFSGALAGGLELERGLGVMEHHDARW